MLEAYDVLRHVDCADICLPLVDYKTKKPKLDESGKPILYINYAAYVDLLHAHGAEKVFFEPVPGPDGSSLIQTGTTFSGSESKAGNRVYETRIRITIDGETWDAQGPVMNGSSPINDATMNQLRLWNAQTRLFVKSCAMRTGLGWELWVREGGDEVTEGARDLDSHSIAAIKERLGQKISGKMFKQQLTADQIAERCGLTRQMMDNYLTFCDQLLLFEQALDKVQ